MLPKPSSPLQVYKSNNQLGGCPVMSPNGVTYWGQEAPGLICRCFSGHALQTGKTECYSFFCCYIGVRIRFCTSEKYMQADMPCKLTNSEPFQTSLLQLALDRYEITPRNLSDVPQLLPRLSGMSLSLHFQVRTSSMGVPLRAGCARGHARGGAAYVSQGRNPKFIFVEWFVGEIGECMQ